MLYSSIKPTKLFVSQISCSFLTLVGYNNIFFLFGLELELLSLFLVSINKIWNCENLNIIKYGY